MLGYFTGMVYYLNHKTRANRACFVCFAGIYEHALKTPYR